MTSATQRAYLDGLTLLARFLTAAGMTTDEFERLRRETNAAIEQILSSPITVLKGNLSNA